MKKNVEEAKVVARQKDFLEVKERECGYVWSRNRITANKFR
jgi:hypothetical protein